ncbi:hypothetical protein [Paractinoplanes brasiliensis]|uniref:Uncharacterized protein n=1 Tax=Paractinoplanes brasiliensis TaxID=52695 RepID=A0A4R6JY74_9ACTN|nr:hypothetical protein [Actinoplanes brasiliensis]TDO41774.1 hypothetical protein C8E87_5516 [Actinoplanes brasiliensis]GID29960.1 hypothetical protein Abr02nite_49430 [Actinoplanes brasiliensis]
MTDEPDGTTAYAASLRPPGHSIEQPVDDQGDLAPEDKRGNRDEGSQPSEVHRAGYNTRDVAGDSPGYRPE